MRALLCVALLTALITVGRVATAGALAGSQLPVDKNSCATCHGEKDLWDGDNLRLFVPLGQPSDDVHWKNGVNCHDCHGGDPGSFTSDRRTQHKSTARNPKCFPSGSR